MGGLADRRVCESSTPKRRVLFSFFFTKIETKNAMNKFCISLDWFQFSVRGLTDKAMLMQQSFYFELTEFHSKFYKKIYKVYVYRYELGVKQKAPFAVVQYDCAVQDLKDISIVKIENALLYDVKCFEYVQKFMEVLHLRFNGVTRIDVAYDCQKMFGGISPLTFMKRYVTASILRVSKQTKCNVHYVQNYKITSDENVDGTAKMLIPESITWGQGSGRCESQIYNKSKELRSKKDKPWIREMWKNAGFQPDRDVYRYELRIKGKAKTIASEVTGEIDSLDNEALINAISKGDGIQRLFYSYADIYARFVVNDYQKNKARKKRFQIFEGMEHDWDYRVVETCRYNTVGRTVKVVRNYMQKFLDAKGKSKVVLPSYIDDRSLMGAVKFCDYILNQMFYKGKYRTGDAEVAEELWKLREEEIRGLINRLQYLREEKKERTRYQWEQTQAEFENDFFNLDSLPEMKPQAPMYRWDVSADEFSDMFYDWVCLREN